MTQNENSDAQGLGLLKFDPIVLVWDVAKQWLLILMVVLIVGMSAYSYATVSYQPQYSTAITYVTYTRSSTATVYSNLSSATAVASVFEELLNSSLLQGVVLRESGLERFDGNTEPHVHFICTRCDGVTDLPQLQVPQALCSQAAAEAGGRVNTCHLSFTGVCRRCNSN